MGLLIARPNLSAGEVIEFRFFANRTQSAKRAVGGRLTVTDRALHFTPHRVDQLFNGESVVLPCADIVEIGIAARDLEHTFGGGLRLRLQVSLINGEELFVANKLDERVPMLQAWLAGCRSDR